MKNVKLFLICSAMFLLFTGKQSGGTSTIVAPDSEPVVIYCHCTFFGACKASGTGSICAQSAPGGNIHCDEYNGNC